MNRRPPYKKPDAIKELEILAMDEARRKHPDMPFLAPRLYRDDTANGLTRCIVDWIRLHGGQAERINSTGRYIDGTKVIPGTMRKIGRSYWIRGSGQRGTADISAVFKGRAVKIEIKLGRDKQSGYQKQYQEQIERSGGIYIIVSDFENFLNQINILTKKQKSWNN